MRDKNEGQEEKRVSGDLAVHRIHRTIRHLVQAPCTYLPFFFGRPKRLDGWFWLTAYLSMLQHLGESK